MKRFLTLLLALCLAVNFAVPVLAMTAPVDEAADMEQSLAEVTSLVKATLQVDDNYTEFYGDYYEDLTLQWSLNWSDENRSLSVTCDENGKVMDAYAYTYTDSTDRFYGFDPAFPALTEAEARAQAEEWLSRLLGEGESGRIDRVSSTLGEDGYYRFYGTILLNGLESPVTFNLRMDKNGLKSYSRSDGYGTYAGEIPGADTSVQEADAAEALFEAVEMELYYVWDEESGQARLQYVPVGAYTVVDGVTGEAVDMDALYAGFLAGGAAAYGLEATAAEAEAPMAMGNDRGTLSEMELESIANYGDAMTQEELDAILRSMKELGLTADFTIRRCSFSMDSETGDITASLRYTAPMTEDNLYGFSKEEYEEYTSWGEELTVYKYVTVNAKTGQLLSLSTSYPLWERSDPGEYNPQDLRDAAASFIALYAVDMAPEAELCTLSGYDQGDTLTYVRVANGWFYPENYLTVEMNPATGTVDGYYFRWDEDVTFAAPAGIVTEEEAEAAYAGALDVTLGYVAWPEELRRDDPELLRYIEWGYTWVESLRLGWYYGGRDEVYGVDAHTGEALSSAAGGDGVYTYTDVADVPEKEAIEALGQAGIGFAGGLFGGDTALTQADAVTLLLQAAGYDPTQWEEDTILSEAVYQGFITRESWAPDKTVTRMEFLKMLLGASRYGDAARLTGVWATSFKDVEESDLAYAALAEALGLAEGKKLQPEDTCTRAMAAEMLCAFMSR